LQKGFRRTNVLLSGDRLSAYHHSPQADWVTDSRLFAMGGTVLYPLKHY